MWKTLFKLIQESKDVTHLKAIKQVAIDTYHGKLEGYISHSRTGEVINAVNARIKELETPFDTLLDAFKELL